MSDKLRIGLLAALVAALALAWWLGGRSPSETGQRTFRQQLAAVDTAALRAFTLTPVPRTGEAPLRFTRDSSGWQVAQGDRRTAAFARPLAQLLAALHRMEPISRPGPDPATLQRYGISDSLAALVQVQDAEPFTLRIGITTGGQEPATAILREGDPNVYLVPGALSWIMELGFEDWITKPMVNGDPAQWERLTFIFPGNVGYVLERSGTGWLVDGQPADSTRVAKYLHALSEYYGDALADPADTLHARPLYTLRVEDRSRQAPVTLVIYDAGHRLIARSSLAPPEVVMAFDAGMELPRMFRPPNAFLPD